MAANAGRRHGANGTPVAAGSAVRDFVTAGEPGAIDALYRRFLEDPHAVPRDVAAAFARFLESEAGADRAADRWRAWGYRVARVDPLGEAGTAGGEELPDHPLRAVYGGPIGWQFGHVPEAERRDWLAETAESGEPAPDTDDRTWILETLVRAEAFERALQKRFPNLKRFSLEGAETFLVLCEVVLRGSAARGIDKVVIGGMHRGRLNILAHLMEKPLAGLIGEIRGFAPRGTAPPFTGDVAYHNGFVSERSIGGRRVRLSMLPHPSHLSVVAAVALGKARAEQALAGPDGAARVLPLMMHTDAAFAGQGIVSEMLQLARLGPFDTGGAVHLVLDNHLGFTTDGREGRSSVHATDIATATGVPVIHVNGDDPDAMFRAGHVAAAYRARFRADVVVSLHAYRRHGHNELDEPRFTQPATYRIIDRHPAVTEIYGAVAQAGPDSGALAAVRKASDAAVAEAARAAEHGLLDAPDAFGGAWSGFHEGSEAEMTAFVATGLAPDRLAEIGRSLVEVPEGFRLHPRVERFLEARRTSLDTGERISWATAEGLAIASLAAEGYSVRLGGQDTPRGAFSQRHLVLHDQSTGATCCLPKAGGPGRVEVFNTSLSEYGVVAFEYGYALADPATLVCWEAQFGDFLNVAQGVIDQFVVCGENRWRLSCGLVLLLPHGLDGGGPDHSTSRPERLLEACAGANLQVVNASTPAQYFHLLRRQMLRSFRKPLAVLTPKAMLRHPSCTSRLDEFGPGTGFRCVLAEPVRAARRVALCSGKVAHELAAERAARSLEDQVAIVRVEQLHPLDGAALRQALAPHPDADLVWCQEEPENMGPFRALRPQIEAQAGRPLSYAGRPASAAPATGIDAWHQAERRRYLDAALEGLSDAGGRRSAGAEE